MLKERFLRKTSKEDLKEILRKMFKDIIWGNMFKDFLRKLFKEVFEGKLKGIILRKNQGTNWRKHLQGKCLRNIFKEHS